MPQMHLRNVDDVKLETTGLSYRGAREAREIRYLGPMDGLMSVTPEEAVQRDQVRTNHGYHRKHLTSSDQVVTDNVDDEDNDDDKKMSSVVRI
ncbi:hypothetical protein BY996DRAFT_6557440 [Phakopsora pachyrhizi]|nr:hypothetical protein BY996DRAFT_6557440 [Phakopsora pachyrhizi]